MNYNGFNIEPFCSDACGDRRRPQTLSEICRNMDSCYGFRAVAAREKYPGLTLLLLWWFSSSPFTLLRSPLFFFSLCSGGKEIEQANFTYYFRHIGKIGISHGFGIFQNGAKLEEKKLNNSTSFVLDVIILCQLILFMLMWCDLPFWCKARGV